MTGQKTIDSDNSNERQLSRLESLPAELREIIIRGTVVEDSLVTAATCTGVGLGNTYWQSSEPGLARTNRQFRQEVFPIYYGENTFTFAKSKFYPFVHRYDVESWLLAIGSAIEHIKWVGANHNLEKRHSDGTAYREDVEVRARPSSTLGVPSTSDQRLASRQWSRECECSLKNDACYRVKPVEHEVEDKLKCRCECIPENLWVCRTIYENLSNIRRLSFAMHFCHSYMAWRKPNGVTPCPECGRPTRPVVE